MASTQGSTQFNIDPDLVAVVNATIRIYLNEADSIISFNDNSLSGAMRVSIKKSILESNNFQIDFAHDDINTVISNSNTSQTLGGNYSPNTLTALITPMSVVTISLRRGNQEYPVFFGVVNVIKESFMRSKKKVVRSISIAGTDLQFYLTNFAYFTLTWLGATANLIPGSVGFGKLVTTGIISGTPWYMGTAFFGIVAASYLQYTILNSGSGQYIFNDLINYCFGPFNTNPATDAEIQANFPLLVNFYASEGSWWEKAKTFFPFPLYEMFFTTVLPTTPSISEVPIYPTALNTGIPVPLETTTSGKTVLVAPTAAEDINTVTVDGLNTTYDVQNCFVARQLPFPQLRLTTPNIPASFVEAASANLLTLDISKLNALGEYIFSTTNPIMESNIFFDASQARTFYLLDPRQISNWYGGKATNAETFMFIATSVGTAFDSVGLALYGYKPESVQVDWLAASLSSASSGQANSDQSLKILASSMLLTAIAYYNPTPLMAHGTIKIPLSPQILPGNKITLNPFKDGTTWTFYIEAVEHEYSFGEDSYTVLHISRGLPTSLYANSTFLIQLLTGQIERVNNQYQVIQTEYNEAIAGIGLFFVTTNNATGVFNQLGVSLSSAQGT